MLYMRFHKETLDKRFGKQNTNKYSCSLMPSGVMSPNMGGGGG